MDDLSRVEVEVVMGCTGHCVNPGIVRTDTVSIVAREARSRRSCGGAGWPFLVRVDGREVVRVSLHQVFSLLERPLVLELIAAAADDELSRVVGGLSCALGAMIGELRTPARPLTGY